MPELLQLEVRSEGERTISGRVIPYGEQITINGVPESFALGAIEGIRADDITLFYHHDHKGNGLPIGRAISLEERADGAYATFRIAQTAKGDEVLQLAREGVLKSFSPGFVEKVRTAAGVITKLARLPEVSLTPFPAYRGAQVLAVRKEGSMDPENETPASGVATATVEPETRSESVDLSPVLTEIEDLKIRMERFQTAFDTSGQGHHYVRIPQPSEWFVAKMRSQFFNDFTYEEKFKADWNEVLVQYRAGNLDEIQTRALADVTAVWPPSVPADDLADIVVPAFMGSQLISILDRRRPMFSNVGRLPMPRSGIADIPKITQHATVAARGAQKTQVPTQKMIIDLDRHIAGWLAGAVDIALEAIRTAEMNVLELVWDDLVGLYAQATEHDTTQGIVPIVDAGITGATYTGAALATNTYAAFVAAVLAAADTVEDNTGAVATKLFVTRTQFNTLLGLINPTVFTATGDGGGATVDLTAQSFTIPGSGIQVIKVKNLDQAILTNEEALKVADSGPEQVTATNVALMGQDLGLLGRTLVVARIPSGIVYFEASP